MPSFSDTTACYTELVTTARHYVECFLFVGIWVAVEHILDLDWHYYALLGIPLAFAFQLLVRRRPIYRLWVRGANRFRLATPIATLGLMLLPLGRLYHDVLPVDNWTVGSWMVCALVGALAAGYALAYQQDESGRTAVPSFLGALVIGIGYVVIMARRAHVSPVPSGDVLFTMLEQAAIYFPLCFILDEVVFRGMLDSHLCSRSCGPVEYWASAVFVSLLWGAWHLPIIELGPHLARNIANVMIMHLVIGVPLSICWRRSGTLVFPAAAHALIFAYRSAIFP